MSDDPKKIFVDDDWKAEAKREKERLAAETAAAQHAVPAPSFPELVNILVMQAMAGLGLLAGPGGQRIPPDPEVAKHIIDMLQLLEDKTKGNLTPEEKGMIEQVLYETRMAYVQIAGGGGMAPGGPPPTPPPQP